MQAISIEKIADITKGVIINRGNAENINGFSLNSKEGNADTIFVPIVGEKVDAHNFIKDAMEHGMRAAFTSRDNIEPGTDSMTYIKVENTLYAFQKIAAWYRNKFSMPIIGITGSVGKTTTKEMVAAAFEEEKSILKTIGNKNSQIGLAQMMFLIEEGHEAGIIEMGMSMEGEMERLSNIARPEACIITNIGVAHIGLLGSRENIRKEKFNIINNFQDNGIIFLNGDDELLMQIYSLWKEGTKSEYDSFPLSNATKEKLKKSKVITYGLSDECDYRACDIRTEGENTYFRLEYKDKDDTVVKKNITLSVLGIHNVRNALAAIAAALNYGVTLDGAVNGLKNYRPAQMRGGIEKYGNVTVIDDTYNASPDSMKSGVDVLRSLEGIKRRIIVLADILELGENSEKYHREVGGYIADNPVDMLVTLGNEAAYIADEVRKNNNSIEVESFSTREELTEFLKRELLPDTAVSLKGSRGMKLDIVVEELRKCLKDNI